MEPFLYGKTGVKVAGEQQRKRVKAGGRCRYVPNHGVLWMAPRNRKRYS
jgi:hypothetical protein